MTAPKKVLVAWSTGKDSAWMLHVLREQDRDVEVAALLTTTEQGDGRTGVHEVPRALRSAQADATGLPSIDVPLPRERSNAAYEAGMARAVAEARARFGITHVAFGDLFLEDIRRYREKQFAGSGLGLLFPLWQVPTPALARRMIAGGLRARLVVVDTTRLDATFAGRAFDDALLTDLPPAVDPCGENGEFHTFAFDGPMFRVPIAHRIDRISEGERFVHAELSGASEPRPA